MFAGMSKKRLQAIADAYWKSGQPRPATKHEIAKWAMREGHWVPQPRDVENLFADQLAKAMGEEYHTDEQGRTVRSKHPRRVRRNGRQLTLWDDMRIADRAHMVVAFQQRRRGIVAECRQLKTDVDSYNENYNPGPAVQTVFDFTDDIAEREVMESFTRSGQAIAPSRPSSGSQPAAPM